MWYFLLNRRFSSFLSTYSLYCIYEINSRYKPRTVFVSEYFYHISSHHRQNATSPVSAGIRSTRGWVVGVSGWVGYITSVWDYRASSLIPLDQRAVKTFGRVRHFIHSRLHNKNCFLSFSCMKTHIMWHDSAVFPPPFNWMELRSNKAIENQF